MRFYFDEHMPRAVEKGLVEQGYEVVMAVDVDMIAKDDLTQHLQYAKEHQAVIVTRDKPFAGRAMGDNMHCGLICWTGAQNDFGGMIRALIEFAGNNSLESAQGRVFWIK
jgi:predicted nuclease of predicted toxin-antitoxin system